MKKFIFLISISLFLTSCANDWSSAGLSGIYEGQSEESVIQTLIKNNWQIEKQITNPDGSSGILASGKPTGQHAKLFGGSCRQIAFVFFRDKGLQLLESKTCK